MRRAPSQPRALALRSVRGRRGVPKARRLWMARMRRVLDEGRAVGDSGIVAVHDLAALEHMARDADRLAPAPLRSYRLTPKGEWTLIATMGALAALFFWWGSL